MSTVFSKKLQNLLTDAQNLAISKTPEPPASFFACDSGLMHFYYVVSLFSISRTQWHASGALLLLFFPPMGLVSRLPPPEPTELYMNCLRDLIGFSF
ncbi:MAG: hypothetical protein IJZ88_04410 [Clostridia bacterium]|nr:hypothetical protein [Clostridia bacterium]